MESLPDGLRVRLRNRETSEYLHADKVTKVGTCVSLRGSWTRGLPSTEWVVHRHQRDDNTYVLRSAVNGGYLSSKFKRNKRGHRFVHVSCCEAPEPVDAVSLWEVFRAPGGGDDVILRHPSNSLLAAVSSFWPRVAAVDYADQNATTMYMHWIVSEAKLPRTGAELLAAPTKIYKRFLRWTFKPFKVQS